MALLLPSPGPQEAGSPGRPLLTHPATPRPWAECGGHGRGWMLAAESSAWSTQVGGHAAKSHPDPGPRPRPGAPAATLLSEPRRLDKNSEERRPTLGYLHSRQPRLPPGSVPGVTFQVTLGDWGRARGLLAGDSAPGSREEQAALQEVQPPPGVRNGEASQLQGGAPTPTSNRKGSTQRPGAETAARLQKREATTGLSAGLRVTFSRFPDLNLRAHVQRGA